MSELIVMLTHNDETVQNAKTIFLECKHLPQKSWGFKNIGLPLKDIKELAKIMQDFGKTVFLEVMTCNEDEGLRWAKIAVECSFDYLLGTVFYPSIADYCNKMKIKYLPFCGKVSGHPAVLEGTAKEITDHALMLQDNGCHGTDVLAWRNTSEPVEIIKELIQKVHFPVCVAGSIASFKQIEIVNALNPWTFTIGSALFDGKFSADSSFYSQLKAVLDYMYKYG